MPLSKTTSWSIHQIVALVAALCLLGLLYFGFDTKPEKQKIIEKSRSQNFENTSVDFLLVEAMGSLAPADRLLAEQKMDDLKSADSLDTSTLKELSKLWYEQNRFALAGYYAERVAEIELSEQAWSIAGTTYAIGLRSFASEKERVFAGNRAIRALENAISFNPSELSHKINLAICYADFPPSDNPMKGIKQLLSLNEQHPENTTVLTALGRLAIQTGQYDKAIVRLEKAAQLMPENKGVYCLLSQAYEATNETSKAQITLEKCNS